MCFVCYLRWIVLDSSFLHFVKNRCRPESCGIVQEGWQLLAQGLGTLLSETVPLGGRAKSNLSN
jgi:hypothetical protein